MPFTNKMALFNTKQNIMRKGKIILSSIALLVTLGNIFSFKNFGVRHQLFAQTYSVCATCATIWTKAGGFQVTSCLTVHGWRASGLGPWQHTFFTRQNVNKTLCSGTFSRITKIR